ncbi:DgyrCDS6412 [Dimorphilus gyrociliatus]|uniref:Target of rapamycin complex subunit lst8 n=1 Tax=Dimorphilus gyrociliatus TaxID=2664684 RepID=A0A7I8VN54_9ANNE|nr:DgyrCDS6412 [Dimorphilus gyrociliatus]
MCSGDQNSVILATAGYDHTIKLWQAHTGNCYRTIQYTDSQINALEITPDKKLITAAGYQHIRMFDLTTSNNNPLVTYDGIQKNITALGFNDDGSWMYTVGEDGFARIWDVRSKLQKPQKMFEINVPINCASLHPNTSILFIGDQSGTMHTWDLRMNENDQIVPEPECSIQSIHVCPNGKYVAAVSNRGALYIWELLGDHMSQLKPYYKKIIHDKYALKCLYSSDCQYLATSSADSSIKIWNTRDMSLLKTLRSDSTQRWVWDVSFSSDSEYIISASSDNMARLWEIESGTVKQKYAGHQKPIVCLAFRDPLMNR